MIELLLTFAIAGWGFFILELWHTRFCEKYIKASDKYIEKADEYIKCLKEETGGTEGDEWKKDCGY